MAKKTVSPEPADDFDVPETVSHVRLAATPPDAAPTASRPATLSHNQYHSEYQELPDSLRGSFALLQEAESQNAETQADEQIKATRLARIKKHIFALQQMPVATLDSENMHRAFKHQDAKAKAERLKVLAREHPEVAEVIAENKTLRQQIEKGKTKSA